MSDYRHDLKRFADAGLQLRLPVDLIPPTQYGRLTNAIPIIEGELRTRSGMIFLTNVTQCVFVYQIGLSRIGSSPELLFTPYTSGYFVGDTLDLFVDHLAPGATSTLPSGHYAEVVATGTGGIEIDVSPVLPVVPVAVLSLFAYATTTATLNALTNTPITNIFRLNQAVPSYADERIVCMAGRVFHALLPSGPFQELAGPRSPTSQPPSTIVGFSGKPFVIIEFRFTKDTVSWAIFADSGQMYKYRPGITDDQIEFVPLGNAPPTVAATYSAGGTGNLNSSGGTGYDWRYTYMDGFALTESNPSPINITGGGTSTTRPTTFTNPAIAGQTAFANPGNAIDGSLTTFSSGSAAATSSTGPPVTTAASCQWQGWAQPAGVVDSVIVNVVAQLTVEADNDGLGTGNATATLQASFDGGLTFQTLKSIHASIGQSTDTGKQTFTATLPSAAAFANFILRATSTATAHGNSRLGDVFTANAQATATLWDINTTVVQEGVVNALALTNKIGVVCVTPSPFPWHTFINLYRRGGSLTDTWRLVGQFPVAQLVQGTCGANTLEIDDNVSDTQLSAQPLIELDNDQPITSVKSTNVPLPAIWGPVGIDARALAVGDPSRPESVYFSKPGNADAWPPENFLEVSSPGVPMVNGCAFNTRNFAFSRESIYELVEGLGTGTTYTPFRTPSAHGLYSRYGLAVGPAMYFISKDGIYMTTGGQEQSIVENDIKPLFPTYDTPGESIEGYEAVDYTLPDNMRLRYHNDELYFCYTGIDTGTRQTLVYDILKKRWRNMTSTVGLSEVYSEPNTISSLLYGTTAGTVYQAGGPVDPSDFDVIENANISAVSVPTAFAAGSMVLRVVRYDALGPRAMSYEIPITVSSVIGAQVTFPLGPTGTTKWRVYYGFNAQGAENQFQEFTEVSLALSRTVQIVTGGTAGTLPTTTAGDQISVDVRTGAHDQGAPLNQKQYGNVIIDLDPGGATVAAPVTITPYINGEAQANAAINVTGTGRQQVPLDLTDYFAFNTEYQITWTRTDVGGGVITDPVLFQYDTLHFLEPVQVTHWEAQPTSFEFPGFVHCRDAYIAIRSTAVATLTMTIDGLTTQTYTIPSTGGLRQKVYIQFASNKGLLYQFAIDSTAGFRVYAPDLEIRVKPWLGVLGYAVQRTLGGEAGA